MTNATRLTFDVQDITLSVDSEHTSRTFEVDAEKRSIFGLAVPYGQPTFSDGVKFQFSQGALVLPEDSTRIKLLIAHDRSTAVGKATELTDSPEGLWARFSVATGPEGDKALRMASEGVWDGLSIGLRDGAKFSKREGVTHFSSAVLSEISLTPDPAFSDARVAAVVAEAPSQKGATVPCSTCGQIHAEGIACPTVPTGFDMTALTEAITSAITAAPRPVVDAGQPVGFEVNESPYAFDAQRGHFAQGGSHEFSTDLFAALKQNDSEAHERVMGFVQSQFAVAQSNVQSALPAGARPDMYVKPRDFRYPLWDAVNKGGISTVAPFVFPRFGSATGLVADHTEGVEPTPGAFTTTSQTVTPKAMSGKVEITREVWDQGGNPQVSNLIWAKMVQSWNEALEAAVVTELNAQAASVGTIALTTAGSNGALVNEVVGAFADLQYVRGGFVFDTFAVQTDLYRRLAQAQDTGGRQLLPAYGPSNATGTARQRYSSLDINGVEAIPAWALAAASANVANSWLFDSQSVHSWSSTPQRLEFQYRVAFVDLAIWGYRAVAISDLTGVRKVSYDPTV